MRAIADDRLAVLYWLLLVTGMRRGEAIGLRWEDVDLDGQALHIAHQITEVRGKSVVDTPKTKRGARLVPIDPVTATLLGTHRHRQFAERAAWAGAWHDSGLVFTREDGTSLRPEYATRHFQALAARADLPAIRLHDLRHTNASLALDAGVDIKIVSERLGHSQIAVTADLYTHVNRGVGQAAAAQIAAILTHADSAVPTASLPQAPQDASDEGDQTDDQP